MQQSSFISAWTVSYRVSGAGTKVNITLDQVSIPKKYRLLHLAVEQNSLVACKAIMRCSDRWLNMDPGLYAEDTNGNTPIDKAVLSQLWACLEYLQL